MCITHNANSMIDKVKYFGVYMREGMTVNTFQHHVYTIRVLLSVCIY